MDIASVILFGLAAYAAVGVVVGIAFALKGVQVVDHAARGAGGPWHFRLVILPGAVLLWPLVLAWWVRAARAAGSEHP